MYAINLSARGARALFALGALGASMAASAAQISDSFTIDYSRTDWENGTLKFGTLDRFNGSLGTLTGVTIQYDASLDSTVKLANLSRSSTASITGLVSGAFVVSDLGGMFPNITGTLSNSVVASNLAINPGFTADDDAIFNSTSGRIFSHVTATNSFSQSSTNSTLLGYLTGTQALDFSITATDKSKTTGPNNIRGVYETLAAGTGTITYTYTAAPVPEPASMAALGLGAVGLLRRKRGAGK